MSVPFHKGNCQSLWMANLILKNSYNKLHLGNRNKHIISLLPFVKLLISQSMQTYVSITKLAFAISQPNQAEGVPSWAWWDGCFVAQKMSQVQPSQAPHCLPTQDQPRTHFQPIYYPFLLAIKNCTWKNNSGVPRSWGPDPIVFCKSKKDQLSMAQICIPTPESVVTHTHTKKPLSAQEQSPLSAKRRWCQLSDYKLLIYASTAAKRSK